MLRLPGQAWRGDGVDRALGTALALFVLVGLIVYFAGPNSRLAAAKIAEAEAVASAGPGPTKPPAPSPSPPSATAAPGGEAARPAAPPSGSSTEDGLVRAPPRPPLSAPEQAPATKAEAEEQASGSAVRLRLLARPIAIDTATFLVQRGKVKLAGVQPVAPSRECGAGASSWPCGMQARTALRLWLRARSIRCDVAEDFGKAEETVDAECSLGPQDIGEWLVENGWAEAKDDGRYTVVEAKARDARRGIWGDGRGAPPSDTP